MRSRTMRRSVFELRFARSARADAAGLPLEVRPHAGQARQRVLELRQLDLQPRFARARAAREDVEDQLRAVHHLDAERLLEIAHLRRREVVVEDGHVGLALLGQRLQLFDLALADERARDWIGAAPLHQMRRRARARPRCRRGAPARRASASSAAPSRPACPTSTARSRRGGAHDVVRALQAPRLDLELVGGGGQVLECCRRLLHQHQVLDAHAHAACDG